MSKAHDKPAPTSDVEPAPAPPAEPAPTTPPERSDRDLWLEVVAVLAVGVIPLFISAVSSLVHPTPARSYWLGALELCLLSPCTSFVVLYLIHRSGESWETFGITRPGFVDACLGLVVFICVEICVAVMVRVLPAPDQTTESLYAVPATGLDRVLMVLKHAANGFAEELVTRAYLITRLSRLLRSDFQAVLLSALLFASYHVYQGPDNTLLIFLMGMIYGGCYLLIRRIWPLAVAHMLYNIYWESVAAAG